LYDIKILAACTAISSVLVTIKVRIVTFESTLQTSLQQSRPAGSMY